MIEKIGDNGSFKKNLNQFHEQGYISKIQKDVLEPILDAGHATIHRNFDPSSKDIEILVDVTESIIEAVYVNENKAKQIQKNVPPRRTKQT